MHQHFMPGLLRLVGPVSPGLRVLDIGCGNGATCGEFLRQGATVVGIDLSEEGIALARKAYPAGRFKLQAVEPDLLSVLKESPFDLVVSTEVVEHLYAPRAWAQAAFSALKPGGHLVCTTPYHGYLKNLCISLAGSWDTHANPLWDGGHIKLWSKKTLYALLQEVGFQELCFEGAGRVPYLWMTMIVRGRKPANKATP